MMALSRCLASVAATSTANAASYVDMARARPIRTKARYSCVRSVARDHSTTPTTPTADPAAISTRPPYRSSTVPTGNAAIAPTRVEIVAAAVTAVRETPRSVDTGISRTVNDWISEP